METILIDTSVWVNIFKGIETKASLFVKHNVMNFKIATCPVVVQEVLQGITNDKQFDKIKIHFSELSLLSTPAYDIALDAAALYRTLRKKGVTVRSSNDCLIALYAINNKIPVLHNDRDFNNIAAFSDLKTIRF